MSLHQCRLCGKMDTNILLCYPCCKTIIDDMPEEIHKAILEERMRRELTEVKDRFVKACERLKNEHN